MIMVHRDAATAAQQQGIYIANMVTAVVGGLSLVPAVMAPFGMGMSGGQSFADVVMNAAVCGGVPLVCVASVIASRWMAAAGIGSKAVAVAWTPLGVMAAALAVLLSSAT